MSTVKHRPGDTSADKVDSGGDIVVRPEQSQIQVANLNTLDEKSKQKILALLKLLYQSLQSTPRGKELLKKLQEGKLYLLVPVDVLLPGNEQRA
ncbi:MAG TPA: hypothetical protein VKA68_16910, partial [bacterium]|nr:hypothetical protein [bacterium]